MKRTDFFLILIGGTIIVIAWIAFSVVHNLQTSTLSNESVSQTLPIAPNFDTNTINKIKDRNMVTPQFNLGNVSASQAGILPTPTPTPTPVLTPLPTIVINQSLNPPTEVSTEGGTTQ